MQLKMERHRMLIIPDNDRDEIYLEEAFHLKSKKKNPTITVSINGFDNSKSYTFNEIAEITRRLDCLVGHI